MVSIVDLHDGAYLRDGVYLHDGAMCTMVSGLLVAGARMTRLGSVAAYAR
jgi:hypothetical protein